MRQRQRQRPRPRDFYVLVMGAMFRDMPLGSGGAIDDEFTGAADFAETLDHDHLRMNHAEMMTVIDSNKVVRDRTQNRFPLLLITHETTEFHYPLVITPSPPETCQ